MLFEISGGLVVPATAVLCSWVTCERTPKVRSDINDTLHHSVVRFSTFTALMGSDIRWANAVEDLSSKRWRTGSTTYSTRMILGETMVNLELGKHDIVNGLALAPCASANAKSNSRSSRMFL